MELRLPYLTVSIFPVILGFLLAGLAGFTTNYFLFTLTLIAAIFLHLGINVINDYYDNKNNTDNYAKDPLTPFAGGSRIIQNKLLTPKEVLNGSIFLFAVSILIGLYLISQTGTFLLYLGMFGVVSGILYSKFNNNFYFGEALVGLNFGVLMTLGSYFVQTQSFSWEVVLISLPMGFLTFLILWVNEFPDYDNDKKAGKITLIVRMGRKNASFVYAVSMIFTYVYLFWLSTALNNPFLLITLLTLPLALISISKVLKFYEQPRKMMASYPSTIALHAVISLIIVLIFAFV